MSLPSLAYSRTASSFHWLVAFPTMGSIATVLKAQQSPKEEKGKWMWRHKSLGLLAGMLILPRVAYRVLSRPSIVDLPGNSAMENTLGKLGHYGLYAFMTIMPATGVAMGYYGGKGLPFFGTKFEGASTPNGSIAKNAFSVHKQLGVYGKYLVPVHVGAAGWHFARGQPIFARINPFRKSMG